MVGSAAPTRSGAPPPHPAHPRSSGTRKNHRGHTLRGTRESAVTPIPTPTPLTRTEGQPPTEQHRLGGAAPALQPEVITRTHPMGDDTRRTDHRNRLTPTCRPPGHRCRLPSGAADGCSTPTFGCPDKGMHGYGPTMVELSTRAAQSLAGRHRARRLAPRVAGVTRSARPLRRASPLTSTAAAVWLALSGCSDYQEGDSLARTIAEDEAALLSKDLGYHDHIRGAEHLATTWVRREGVGAGSTVRREAVSCSDRTVGSGHDRCPVRRDGCTVEEPLRTPRRSNGPGGPMLPLPA